MSEPSPISENLAPAELTALERDEHVAEWIRLADIQSRQPDANENPNAKTVEAIGMSLELEQPRAILVYPSRTRAANIIA